MRPPQTYGRRRRPAQCTLSPAPAKHHWRQSQTATRLSADFLPVAVTPIIRNRSMFAPEKSHPQSLVPLPPRQDVVTQRSRGKPPGITSQREPSNQEKALKLPDDLFAILDQDSELAGLVRLVLTDFAPLLYANRMTFFPEYTDHGSQHIESVLRTASALITTDSLALLTPTDVATLTLATLLHDLALHFTEDAFQDLITSTRKPRTPMLDARNWPDEWAAFLHEAVRWNGAKLLAVFDDPEPLQPPSDKPDKWSWRDRVLIGEFIRRHHHRIAHELALGGLPGPQAANRLGLRDYPADLADLAGCVARSHGIPLRAALPYLRSEFHSVVEYRGVHAVFLMAVLRIADYLEIEASRAPAVMLKVLRLRSPVSGREWRAHHAIRDCRWAAEDPESIFVGAQPDSLERICGCESGSTESNGSLITPGRSWAKSMGASPPRG